MSEFGPEVMALYERLEHEARSSGYHLNPDRELTLRLVAGLHKNLGRYGYAHCPCRLAFGSKELDLDVVCPCDYRDPDLDEYGACYCGLYVSQARIAGIVPVRVVPERRPVEYVRNGFAAPGTATVKSQPGRSRLPIWRCRVCGYLCAREQPPELCPICKARRERFEAFERL